MVTIIQNVKNVDLMSPVKLTSTKGTILYQDDGEGTLKWGNLGGGTVAKDTTGEIVYSGTNDIKLTTQAGGTFQEKVEHSIASRPEVLGTNLGIEQFFFLPSVLTTAVDKIVWYLEVYDGATRYIATITWQNGATPKFQYLNSASATVDITDGAFTLTVNKWYRIKLVINTLTGKYQRLEIGNKILDLSTLAMPSGANTANYVYFSLNFFAIDATQRNMYIEDFAITYNEPG